MGNGKIRVSKARAYLAMSRMSNLPTVWSNCMVGIASGGGSSSYILWSLLLASLSLYYIAGMFLNDACDSEFDALRRPERPIPQGIIGKKEAFTVASALLLSANALLIGLALVEDVPLLRVLAWGLLLTATIVLYDCFHKRTRGGPILMSLCRIMVYIIAAQMVESTLDKKVWLTASMLGTYILGLSLLARQETAVKLPYRWPVLFLYLPCLYILPTLQAISAVFYLAFLGCLGYCTHGILQNQMPRFGYIGILIAGIALWDAVVLATMGFPALSMVATLGFALTIALHKFIPGS